MKNDQFPWDHGRRFNSYTEYIKKQFGGRVQKVAVDAGFTCPNRDGSKGTGGCTYCDNDAFNPSYCKPEKSISQQISEGIDFHAFRYRRATEFLVYFQPYSNTYAPLSILMEKYGEALVFPDVAGLVIGPRTDCMDEEKLEYLSELAKRIYILVEYGVESVYDRTLQRINRGHTFEEAREMITRTHEKGIRTGAHFIFGLPGETVDDMWNSAGVISSLPIDTVKFHQLQIVKGTRMEKEFRERPGDFHRFTLEGYIDFIISFIEKLNPSIVIERFTGEVPPRFIETGNWGLIRADEVLRKIEKEMEQRETWQGKKFVTGDG